MQPLCSADRDSGISCTAAKALFIAVKGLSTAAKICGCCSPALLQLFVVLLEAILQHCSSAARFVRGVQIHCKRGQRGAIFREPSKPRTEKAISTRKRKGKQTTSKAGKKRERKRLSVYDVAQLILSRDITSLLELAALVAQQNRAGKRDLSEFIASRGQRAVEDALQLAKEFMEAEAELATSKKGQLDLLEEAYKGECASECNERWLWCMTTLIENNGILLNHFSSSIYIALHQGRGKYCNIYVHRTAHEGKTFILTPLRCI